MEEMYCCDRLVLYVQKLWGDCGPSTPELWSMKFGLFDYRALTPIKRWIFLGKAFGSLKFQQELLHFVDCHIGENLNNRQLEKREHYCAELVLYVQKAWGETFDHLLHCTLALQFWTMVF